MTTNPDYADMGENPGVTPQQVGRITQLTDKPPERVPLNPQQKIVIAGTTPDWPAQVASAEGVVMVSEAMLNKWYEIITTYLADLSENNSSADHRRLIDIVGDMDDKLRAL